MQKIKNIIFDLGGVFINIDYSKTEKAFADLGIQNFGIYFNQNTASDLFQNFEVGKISELEFFERFRTVTNVDLSNESIVQAWNAMLGDFPKERLEWLKKIRTKYRVYLFSNTNSIHHKGYLKIFQKSTGEDNFDKFFIKAYYSHTLGLRKPNVEAFEKIIELAQLNPAETLFVDDTAVNIKGAKEAGLNTIHLKPPQTVLDLEL